MSINIGTLSPTFPRWAFTDPSAGFRRSSTGISCAVCGLSPLGYHLSTVAVHGRTAFPVCP